MSGRVEQNQAVQALAAIGWPVLVGAAACSGFYVLIHQGPLHTPFMLRNFASHPIAYVQTAISFIGLSVLLLNLGALLRHSMAAARAKRFGRWERSADQRMRGRWDQWKAALNTKIRETRIDLERSTLKPASAATAPESAANEILEKTLRAETANASLPVTPHHENPVLGLSAAIHLLAERLSQQSEGPASPDKRHSTRERAVEGPAA